MVVGQILRGLASKFPGVQRRLGRNRTGGTDSGRYCYAVWLRHIVVAHHHGLPTAPRVVAELGPGDSLGTGLAALLSGVARYTALDVVEYANLEANLAVLEELETLFQERAPIPGPNEFPELKPELPSYDFPDHILPDSRLRRSLDRERIGTIRESLLSVASADEDSMIRYVVPWADQGVIQAESVDMILSQAVLEHVVDLADTYEALHSWLKPGGFMSNQIDFRSHGTSKRWNGHWGYSPFLWALIKGNRPTIINRQPFSMHVKLMKSKSFDVIAQIPDTAPPTQDGAVHCRMSSVTADDLRIPGAHFLARKPASSLVN